jgi:hypothetical protein
VLSEYRLSLIASSRLCTPNVLSRIELEAIDGDCAGSRASSGILRPRDCALFSMSRSLRRKKVVGPEGPGLEVGGGLKADLLDFSVRLSCGVYIMIAGPGRLSGQDMVCPKRSTEWYQKAGHIER